MYSILNIPFINGVAKKAINFTNTIRYKTDVVKTIHKFQDITYSDSILAYNKNRDFGYNKLICLAPATSLYFNIHGDILACCKNTIDKLGNISTVSIEEAWNGTARQILLQKVRNYNLEDGCSFCKVMLLSKNYTAVLAKMYDVPFPVYNNKFPTDITLEISNTCNLECIMCMGDYSSSIRKNREQLPPIRFSYPSNFVQQLQPFLLNLKTLRLQGGEPFLINVYLEILDFLLKNNPKCRVYIQTNGTVFNNRVKNILELSKNIHLSISIDSLKEMRYEYIRKNARFKNIIANIHSFKEACSKNKTSININFCLMNNNWMELPTLFEFCYKNSFNLNIIPVDNPPIYSLSNLGLDQLVKVYNFLNLEISIQYRNSYLSIYNSVINYLDSLRKHAEDNDKLIAHYMCKDVNELYELIKCNLVDFLPRDNIEYIISIYKHDLATLDTQNIKYILAKTIQNNLVIVTGDKMMDYYNEQFTRELIRYFKFEIGNLI